MSEIIITVENLSKQYRVGHLSPSRERYTTLRDVIARETRKFVRNAADLLRGRQIIQGDEIETFWALRDVSFNVRQGDVIGIIGHNGAGKSTLLKILSRITEPTQGRITLRGRVASLLEVGTGFHPELTGRENIFLNGAILGMTQREIRKKFDEIVAFAEVENFLDTPVKRFSSGMHVRLAFAVAAHLDPDILIVDEVLAVGDAAFQNKCLGKMDEVSRREGRTVLFVSHSMSAVSTLCPTAIWLDGGRILAQGAARAVIGQYLGATLPKQSQIVRLDGIARRDESPLGLLCLQWISPLPLQHGEPVRGRISLRTRAELAEVSIGIGFSTIEGSRLLTYETAFRKGQCASFERAGDHSVEFEIDVLPLTPGIYRVDIECGSSDAPSSDCVPAAARIEVVAGPCTPSDLMGTTTGVRLASKWIWLENAGNGG
jgi:lipopolysaccharide transport system ATP-binding protein